MDGMKLGIHSREYSVHGVANHIAIKHSFKEAAVGFVDIFHGICVTDINLIWTDSNNRACWKAMSVHFW